MNWHCEMRLSHHVLCIGFRAVVGSLLLCIAISAASREGSGAEPKVLTTPATGELAGGSPIKNVLFIVSDDLKASVLGCYGDPNCKTPNIDALAERSMVFERAYCQGVVCGPSRRSFMFSRYTGKAPVNLGQHFRESGWYSARVGKIYHMRVPGDIIAGTNGEDEASSWTERFNAPGPEAHTPGDYACLNLNVFTDSMRNRESTQTKHRMFVTVETDGLGEEQADYKATSKAIELLETNHAKPFFLALGLVRPHYPMVAPRNYFSQYPWQNIKLPYFPEDDYDDIPKAGLAGTRNSANPIGQYPDNQKRMWSGYYASVTFMDQQVGRILSKLDELGLRESTAIVFISDHGYHLGEHGFWQKANLHEEAIRVPMIISVPGMKPGRSESFVELLDLFPTLSDLVGLPIPETVQGMSLRPILQDPSAKVRDAALSINKGHSLRDASWHYMIYKDGSEELYDVQKDPGEIHNLVQSDAHSRILAERRLAMKNRLNSVGK